MDKKSKEKAKCKVIGVMVNYFPLDQDDCIKIEKHMQDFESQKIDCLRPCFVSERMDFGEETRCFEIMVFVSEWPISIKLLREKIERELASFRF